MHALFIEITTAIGCGGLSLNPCCNKCSIHWVDVLV